MGFAVTMDLLPSEEIQCKHLYISQQFKAELVTEKSFALD